MRTSPEVSGDVLVTCLCRHWDYHVVKQIGHHLRLETSNPRFQRITILLKEKITGELLQLILKSVAAQKRVEINHILDTL